MIITNECFLYVSCPIGLPSCYVGTTGLHQATSKGLKTVYLWVKYRFFLNGIKAVWQWQKKVHYQQKERHNQPAALLLHNGDALHPRHVRDRNRHFRAANSCCSILKLLPDGFSWGCGCCKCAIFSCCEDVEQVCAFACTDRQVSNCWLRMPYVAKRPAHLGTWSFGKWKR